MEEQVFDCVMPYIQDLNSVSLVSRKYYDIDSLTRKRLTVYVHYLPEPSRLIHRFPNLESLTLKSYSHGFDTAEKCGISVTPWIEQIAVEFKRLKSLSIRNMVMSASDLKHLAKTRGGSLRSLEIRGCKMFSEDGLEDIARCCIDLRSLRLEYNWIEYDYMPNGKWLHEFALHNTVMESLYFQYPFDWHDSEDVTRIAKKCSKSLVSLTTTPHDLIDFREFFKHAKKLDHFGYGIISEGSDYSGFEFPPNIRGLRIRDLRDAQFHFLRPYFNQLRELDLECAGTHLKNLRVFRNWWKGKDGITDSPLDNGVRAMLMGCSKLERLDIMICVGGLTDVGLGYIGKYGHNLRYLCLRNTGESDVGLLELSKGCPKLRKLKLWDCPFSKQAVATFPFNIFSLRYVWVESGVRTRVLTRPMVSAEDCTKETSCYGDWS